MLDCLKGYIGFLGCDTETPPGNLYVNSLTGITLKSLEGLTTEEKTTFRTLITDIEIRALARLEADLRQRFNKTFKISSITEGLNLKKNITGSTIAAADKLRGFTMENDWWEDRNYKNSVLLKNYIQTVSLYAATGAITSTIKVVDADLKTVIDTINISIEAGWNEYQVNKSYDERNIWVLFDANIFDAQELILPDSLKPYASCVARVRGIEVENDYTSPVYGDNIFGLTGIIGNRCSWEAFVCQNKDLVKIPLWYLLGSEVMSERLSSSRFSQWTTVQKDHAERSKLMYDIIYAGGTFEGVTYEGVINQMIDGVNISGDDCCLECNAPIRVKEISGRY